MKTKITSILNIPVIDLEAHGNIMIFKLAAYSTPSKNSRSTSGKFPTLVTEGINSLLRLCL